jgi:hypothetical protein
MARYDVYAVRKDEETGNIKECYIHEGIDKQFSSKEVALKYVRSHCVIKNKTSVLVEMGLGLTNPSTMLYNAAKGKFVKGARIHIYGSSFLRTDGNDTTRDNLENIMEIP